GVGVELRLTLKDLEVPEHVADDEADQDEAGDRHHRLLPDRGIPDGGRFDLRADRGQAERHGEENRWSRRMLPSIRLHALLVEVADVAVVDDDRRKALDLEPPDRLGAQVIVLA